MYIVTFKDKPIALRSLFIIENLADEKIYLAPDNKCIMSRARHEVIKEYFKLVGHPWNRRDKSITMHRMDDYGNCIEDVTDTYDWRERKQAATAERQLKRKARRKGMF